MGEVESKRPFHPTPQPEFPREDLNAENMRYLSLAMANREILNNHHAFIVSTSSFANPLMSAAELALRRLYSDVLWTDFEDASLHGIKIFESLAGFVESNISHVSTEKINRLEGSIADFSATELNRYRSRAVIALRDNKNTRETIKHSAERFYPSLTYSALLGGAIAQKIALDAINDAELYRGLED